MSKLTEVFWESVPKSWCSIHVGYMERLQNLKEGETGGRDRDKYSDERVHLGGWMVSNWRM